MNEERGLSKKAISLWIAKMAACDGVITPQERKTICEFARTFGLDRAKLLHLAYGLSAEYDNEVIALSPSQMKGRRFEDFVVSMFADSQYTLMEWRGDKRVGKLYARGNMLPDLEIIYRKGCNRYRYLVECKYRSEWKNGEIDISQQLIRYHDYAMESRKDLFIALGVGGGADNPEEFYIIPESNLDLGHVISYEHIQKWGCGKTIEDVNEFLERYFVDRTSI
ncbi:MAG: hypothetical protein PHR45_02635 [Muribaculaceae bacterium]|nr:hypothetical protein [Muribaculaceae bacterium]